MSDPPLVGPAAALLPREHAGQGHSVGAELGDKVRVRSWNGWVGVVVGWVGEWVGEWMGG